ncbi:MAG: molybdopterin-dependent oxidoreductase, partial [Actinomycetota bacterium]
TRPDAQAYDLLPVIVGMAAAVLVLLPLVRSAKAASAPSENAATTEPPASPETSPQPMGRPGRRTFLRVAAAVGALAAGAGGIGRWLGSRRLGVESSREDLAAPQALPRDLPEPAVPDGVNVQVPDVAPWRTPNDDFYLIDTALSKPLVHPEDWSLRVHGMVEEELMLSFDDLVSIGLIDRWITLCCVSNQVGGDLIGNALWTGVRTSDVLGMAGPLADADAVKSTSYDGWNCGTPLEALTDGRDSMFAVAMNGEPLPVEHGFPVRMVVPGLYGYVSATKWVVNLEVTRFDEFEAYWTQRGWAERGPVKVQSRIDVPSSGAGVAAGTVPVAGVAWAQHRGIERVEVRVDEGPWQAAELADVPSRDTWRQWVWRWDAEPGDHRLEVRATTTDGEVQTGTAMPPVPSGATGWHGIEVSVTG